MALGKVIVGLIIINILIFGGYYFYNNVLESRVESLVIPGISSTPPVIDVSSDVEQFYDNMRFNHNQISYYINPDCSSSKEERMKDAFAIITAKTGNLIDFFPTSESKAEILVGCSQDSYEKEENVFIAGEGGPTKIINSTMPVILRGKVLLYNESRSICTKPILELHELLHVFGYTHIDNEEYIMYPYLDCEQRMNPDLITNLIELYTIEPFAELYYEEIYAYRERYLGKWYLNFNVTISNEGIINAENVILKAYENGKLIESFELDDIKFGGGERFYIKNLLIESSSENIKFEIVTDTIEQDKENNLLELEIQAS